MLLQKSSQLSGFSGEKNDDMVSCCEMIALNLDDMSCFEEENNGCEDSNETNVRSIIYRYVIYFLKQ